MANNRVRVTPGEFCDKMNACLREETVHEGAGFQCDNDGFILIAPSLGETSKMALSKTIFDKVSAHSAITSD